MGYDETPIEYEKYWDNVHPKITVLMPVYNEEKFLDEGILSILNQTFSDFELIVINDASTDNSLKIIKSYKDKRIKLINLKKNVGVTNARNIGLKKAKGRYIAMMDGDDISYPNRLYIQFVYLEHNPHIFLVGTSAIYINEKGDEIRRFRKYNNYKILSWRLTKSCSIVNSSVMFRNEGFLYDPFFKSASDYEFYPRLLKKGKNITNLPDFLVKYRVNSGSMSIYNKKEQEMLRDKILKKYKNLDKTNIVKKFFYSIILLFHYLRTFKEKQEING